MRKQKEATIPQATTIETEHRDSSRAPSHVNYKVGDKVVYPHHGAGKVLKKEKKEMLGEVREYLTIKILHNDMTVMVPTDSAGRAGLRRVIGEDDVERVLAVLRDDISQMPKNWNRRFKHNRDKMKTGDIFELAEVVRNLAIRDFEKGLSTGEKQMFTRAKKILSSELMYALDMDEKEAEEYLDELLEETNQSAQQRLELAATRATGPAGGASMATALVAAAGAASGWAPGTPKALVELGGPAAGRLVPRRAGRRRRRIDRVVIAAPPGLRGRARGGRAGGGAVAAMVAVTPGGASRSRVGRERARGGSRAPTMVAGPRRRPAAGDGRADRPLRGAARALGLRRRRRGGARRRHDQGGRRRRPRHRDARPQPACGRCRRRRSSAPRSLRAALDAGRPRRAPTTTPSWSRRPAATCGSSRRRAHNIKVTTQHRPAGRGAAARSATRRQLMLTDYHTHLRPDDPDASAERVLHGGQRRALSRGGAAERGHRRARVLRARLPVPRGARRSGAIRSGRRTRSTTSTPTSTSSRR